MARTANKASGETAPVYEVLAHDIKAMGVEAVFGLMSDDTALFATSLDTAGVRFFGARHENAAIAMADGYAYATGRLGVAGIEHGRREAHRPGHRFCVRYAVVSCGAPRAAAELRHRLPRRHQAPVRRARRSPRHGRRSAGDAAASAAAGVHCGAGPRIRSAAVNHAGTSVSRSTWCGGGAPRHTGR